MYRISRNWSIAIIFIKKSKALSLSVLIAGFLIAAGCRKRSLLDPMLPRSYSDFVSPPLRAQVGREDASSAPSKDIGSVKEVATRTGQAAQLLRTVKDRCEYYEKRAIAYLPAEIAKRYCLACHEDLDQCTSSALQSRQSEIQRIQRRKDKFSCLEKTFIQRIIELSYGKPLAEKTYLDRRMGEWFMSLAGMSHLYKANPMYSENMLPKDTRQYLHWLRRKGQDCGPWTEVKDIDLETIYEWVRHIGSGQQTLPKVLFLAEDKGTRVEKLDDEMLGYFKPGGFFDFHFESPPENFPVGTGRYFVETDKWWRHSSVLYAFRMFNLGTISDFFNADVSDEKSSGEKLNGIVSPPSAFVTIDKAGDILALYMIDWNATCPYTYVHQADGSDQKEGAVINNLRRLALDPGHSLTLRTSVKPGQTLTVQLCEEKQEITYLDTFRLDLCGQQILPKKCIANKGTHRPNYCDADDIYDVFKLGEYRKRRYLSLSCQMIGWGLG